MTLSIIICTYNRALILKNCLESIMLQTADMNAFQVVIIDNHSTDGTQSVIKLYENRFNNFHSVIETKVGHSHARNRGSVEANGQWLAYIDDDVLLSKYYIERAIQTINNFDFDCFGGTYSAKYKSEKPNWISEDFETMSNPRDSVGYINTSELVGMNFLIKKQVLLEVGGFNSEFGMSGHTIGYGDENELQERLLRLNYKLGFDPELVVDNFILPHKITFSWHLKSWYAHGRDGQRCSSQLNFLMILFFTLRSIIGGFFKTPLGIGKLVLKKDYFWQNMVWDILSPVLYRFGQIVGALS